MDHDEKPGHGDTYEDGDLVKMEDIDSPLSEATVATPPSMEADLKVDNTPKKGKSSNKMDRLEKDVQYATVREVHDKIVMNLCGLRALRDGPGIRLGELNTTTYDIIEILEDNLNSKILRKYMQKERDIMKLNLGDEMMASLIKANVDDCLNEGDWVGERVKDRDT